MSVNGFEPERGVEIIAPGSVYGSGYRIGGRLVLTAAHLFADSDSSRCNVRCRRTFGEVKAEVVWKTLGVDVALVELPREVEACEPVKFGQFPTQPMAKVLPFELYAWPRWAWTTRPGETPKAGGRHIVGKIYLGDTSPEGLLVVEPERVPEPPTSKEKGSEWKGISGAAVVCCGYVVAVQRHHQNPRRPASLEAEPLSKVYSNKDWLHLLELHGIDGEPEDVLADRYLIQDSAARQQKPTGRLEGKLEISDIQVHQNVDTNTVTLDFRVHNSGEADILINRIDLRADTVETICTFGYMKFSALYDLDISDISCAGDVATCPTSQIIYPGKADRFGIVLAARGLGTGVFRCWIMQPIIHTNFGSLTYNTVEIWLPSPLGDDSLLEDEIQGRKEREREHNEEIRNQLSIACSGSDKEKMEALKMLGELFGWKIRDDCRVREFYVQALDLAHASGDRDSEFELLGRLGWTYRCLNKENLAIESFKKALSVARETANRQGEIKALRALAQTYSILAVSYSKSDSYRTAIEFYQQGLNVCRGIREKRLEAAMLFELSEQFAALDKWTIAVKNVEMALEIYEELMKNEQERKLPAPFGIDEAQNRLKEWQQKIR